MSCLFGWRSLPTRRVAGDQREVLLIGRCDEGATAAFSKVQARKMLDAPVENTIGATIGA